MNRIYIVEVYVATTINPRWLTIGMPRGIKTKAEEIIIRYVAKHGIHESQIRVSEYVRLEK